MAKKKNGNGNVIGLARNYIKGFSNAPYVLLKQNGEGYSVGSPKGIDELVPYIDRKSYREITFSAREFFLTKSKPGRTERLVMKLEVVKIDLRGIK